MLPQSDTIINAVTKVSEGFHYFWNLVIAEGPMTVTDSGLAELELSTTLGMSGSPIFVKIESRFDVIGIYCGEPPLPGQRELIKIIELVRQNDIKNAYGNLKAAQFSDRNLYNLSYNYVPAKRNLQDLLYFMFGCQERVGIEDEEAALIASLNEKEFRSYVEEIKQHACDEIVILLQESLMGYKNSQEICFNSGISIRAKVFDHVKNAKSFFAELSGNFESAKNLEGHLWNYLSNRF